MRLDLKVMDELVKHFGLKSRGALVNKLVREDLDRIAAGQCSVLCGQPKGRSKKRERYTCPNCRKAGAGQG